MRPTLCQRSARLAPRSQNITFEDAALVRQTQEGDIRAFEKLVIKYQDRVFNICVRMVGHHENARDLTQDTFLKALDAIDRFEHRSGFYTWLFRIAVHLCISFRRSNREAKTLSLSGRSEDDGMEHQALKLHAMARADRSLQPAAAMQSAETRRAVLDALAELDDDHRVILVLRDMDGLDYGAISDVLEIPIGTVRSRLHRARLAMRELLKPVLEKAG